MILAEYAEELYRPVANVKINGIGKIVKPPRFGLLYRISPRSKLSLVNGPNTLMKS